MYYACVWYKCGNLFFDYLLEMSVYYTIVSILGTIVLGKLKITDSISTLPPLN